MNIGLMVPILLFTLDSEVGEISIFKIGFSNLVTTEEHCQREKKHRRNWPTEPNMPKNANLACRWSLTWSKGLWETLLVVILWSIRSFSPLLKIYQQYRIISPLLFYRTLWGLMIKDRHMCLDDPVVHRGTTGHISIRASANSVPSFIPMVTQMPHVFHRLCWKKYAAMQTWTTLLIWNAPKRKRDD